MSKQYKLLSCTINEKKVEKMIDLRASLTDTLQKQFLIINVKKRLDHGK